MLLQVLAEVAKKAKPTTMSELLTAAIDYALKNSRDGREALIGYLRGLEDGS